MLSVVYGHQSYFLLFKEIGVTRELLHILLTSQGKKKKKIKIVKILTEFRKDMEKKTHLHKWTQLKKILEICTLTDISQHFNTNFTSVVSQKDSMDIGSWKKKHGCDLIRGTVLPS
uniref:Uncharacterized protein n=1 Tax=Octopus bimaculoides TaxID=37653 RepID=A0A0L8IEX8_OCTBM